MGHINLQRLSAMGPLVLREIEGLAYEIAEVAGAPIGTVMSRLARGRSELRKTLTRLMKKGEPHAM